MPFALPVKERFRLKRSSAAPTEVPVLTRAQSRAKAIKATMKETGYDEDRVTTFLNWLGNFANHARAHDYEVEHPNARDLASTSYRIFEQVIPHGQASRVGSAHEAIEQAVLNPERGEFSIRHDMDGKVVQDCTITILVGQV